MRFSLWRAKIENQKPIDFGSILSKTFDLFKKVWLEGFFMILFVIVIIFILVGIAALPIAILMNGNFFVQTGVSDTNAVIISVAVIVFAFFLMGAIILGFTAGFFTICKEKDFEDGSDSGSLFLFFSKKYILKTFVLGAAYFGVLFLGYILCFFPAIYLLVPLSYLMVIYAFNPELSVSEIIKLSFKIGNKNWLMTFLLILITGIISQLGIFLCGIGLFFTMAYNFLPVYLIYKDVIGFEKMKN